MTTYTIAIPNNSSWLVVEQGNTSATQWLTTQAKAWAEGEGCALLTIGTDRRIVRP